MPLQTKVREALEKPIHEIDSNLLIELYREVFFLSLDRSCPSCVMKAYHELKEWLSTKESTIVGINLITCEYVPADENRRHEIEFCLKRNRESGYFKNVITVNHKPTFAELFEITRASPDDINIISNTDIFFDNTINEVKNITSREAWALTRWNYLGDNRAEFFNRHDSQDVWIFRGAVRKETDGKYGMGVAGCDNRLAFELKKAGYLVRNPSLSIRAYHYHLSEVRTFDWNDKVPEPYLFLPPQTL